LSKKGSNLKHLDFGKFNLGVIFAFEVWGRAMLAFIKVVLGPCVPPQIGQKAVGADTIFMAPFLSRRAWPHEGGQDESVNEKSPSFRVVKQIYGWIAIGVKPMPEKFGSVPDMPCPPTAWRAPVRPNPSEVRHFIPFKSFNWQPSLLNVIGDCVKLGITHGLNLLQGLSFGQGRPGAQTPCGPFFFIPQPLAICQQFKGQNG
jgi:hypothetical protein